MTGVAGTEFGIVVVVEVAGADVSVSAAGGVAGSVEAETSRFEIHALSIRLSTLQIKNLCMMIKIFSGPKFRVGVVRLELVGRDSIAGCRCLLEEGHELRH